ncbi:MAG TPA: SipW-dependent-type signal peptide-containing protein [Gryllotalpicola sp.]
MHHPFGGRASLAVRAVLAFGLVLGVGAAATEAQWTDQEFAAGSFTTGTFAPESSTSTADTDYGAHPSDNPATLDFASTGMYPGQTVAAPFAVRAATGTLGGTVALSLSSSSGSTTLLAALVYRIFADTVSGCTTDSPPSAGGAWIAGSATTFVSGLTTPVPANSRTLPAASATAPGAAVYYCLNVQLPASADNSLQNQTATASWVVTGSTS